MAHESMFGIAQGSGKDYEWAMRYLLEDSHEGGEKPFPPISIRLQRLPVTPHGFANENAPDKFSQPSVPVYDYRNRVYSAELGRFLQTDPIRFEAGDGNLYRYVGNTVANYTDPEGKIVGSITKVLYIAWVAAATVIARNRAKADIPAVDKDNCPCDKTKHCYASCLLDESLLRFQPWVTELIGTAFELITTYDYEDIAANKAGIAVSQARQDCLSTCLGLYPCPQ